MNHTDTYDSLAVRMPHVKWIADIPASRLFELLLWLAFVGLIIPLSDSLMGPGIRRILMYSCYLSGILLIVLSCRYVGNIGEYARINPGHWLLVPMIMICFLCACIGVLLGGPAVIQDLFIHSVIPYGAAVLMLPAAHKDIRDRLCATFQAQTLVAVVFAVFAIWHTQKSGQIVAFDRIFWYESFEKSAYHMLSLLPFLAGYAIGKRNVKTILILAFGYLMTIVLSLRGANRASLVIALIIIPVCVLAIYWKRNGLFRVAFFTVKIVFVMSLFFVFVRIAVPSLVTSLNLGASAAFSIYRFTQSYDVSTAGDVKEGMENSVATEAQFSRGAEAEDFINGLEFPEHLIGKGFGMKWYSAFWGMDWPIVHIGPLHLILKGGLLLLVTYYLLFFFTVKTSWKHSDSDPVAMGSFVYLVSWIAQFHLYGPQAPSQNTYVFWLIAGMALSSKSRQKPCAQANL